MPEPQTRPLAEVTFIEAVARHARVDLILSPVVADGERRLISHFLGREAPSRLILAPPKKADGQKVFVPVGWDLGMSFDLANVWFQATTTVLEHCMFRQSASHRVDALAVEHPTQRLSATRRGAPRRCADPARPFTAIIWSAERVVDARLSPLQVGMLQDWSATGLGARLRHPLGLAPGDRAIICLERVTGEESIFLWGVLRHCTATDDGYWLAGFGDLTDMRPGEAVDLMSFLAAPAE